MDRFRKYLVAAIRVLEFEVFVKTVTQYKIIGKQDIKKGVKTKITFRFFVKLHATYEFVFVLFIFLWPSQASYILSSFVNLATELCEICYPKENSLEIFKMQPYCTRYTYV